MSPLAVDGTAKMLPINGVPFKMNGNVITVFSPTSSNTQLVPHQGITSLTDSKGPPVLLPLSGSVIKFPNFDSNMPASVPTQIFAICVPTSSNLMQPYILQQQQQQPQLIRRVSNIAAPQIELIEDHQTTSPEPKMLNSPSVIVSNPNYSGCKIESPSSSTATSPVLPPNGSEEALEKWHHIVVSEAKDLEEFAKSFKARRIELGYTQEMVANEITNKMGYSCQQAVICYFEKMQMSTVRMHRLKSLLEKWLQEAKPAANNIPSLCRPRKRRSSAELFPLDDETYPFSEEEKGKVRLDVINLVKRFRTKRKQLGISQQRAAEELQAMHGRSFSQAFISLFETLQMSLSEASQFKHYFEEWINSVDTLIGSNPDGSDNQYGLTPSRKKIRIDPKKKATLEVIFNKHPNPKPLERREIAESLELPTNTVQNWFAFRRHKEKQQSSVFVPLQDNEIAAC